MGYCWVFLLNSLEYANSFEIADSIVSVLDFVFQCAVKMFGCDKEQRDLIKQLAI